MARKACNTVGMDMGLGLPRRIYSLKCFNAAAAVTEPRGVAKTLLIT